MKLPRLYPFPWSTTLATSRVAVLFLLLPLISSVGCSSPKRTNLWPFYFSKKDFERHSVHREILWPFGEFDRSPELEQSGLRPFVNRRVEVRAEKDHVGGQPTDGSAEEVVETHVLYPLFESRREPMSGNEHAWLFPLYYHKQVATRNGERRLRVVVPFLRVSGHDPEKGNFAATPLYGNIYHILGYERIHLVAFPCYVRTVAGNRDSVNVIFPFFSHTVAPGYSYWRVWPLAGYASQDGQFAHGFLLWPFINYRVEQPGTEREAKTFMLFPLFGFSANRTTETQTVLWPFFSHQRSRLSAERQEWNVPTPIARYHRSKRVRQISIWPIYGESQRDNYRSRYVLWPLYRRTTAHRATGQVEEFSAWPFYRNRTVAAHDGRLLERSVRVWPLAMYRGSQQRALLNLLSLWPAEHQQGIERNWSVFWTFLRYECKDNRNRRVRVLGRLVDIERTADGGVFGIGPLLRAEKAPKGKGLSILGGLLEVGVLDGRSANRILFIPLKPRDRDDSTIGSSRSTVATREDVQ